MKIASLLVTCFASAAAFAPVNPVLKTSTSLNSFEGELGDQAPLGYWDPVGFSADGDIEKFERFRYVELKHGRICMLAFLGEVVTRAGIHLPGSVDLSGTTFDSIPNGWSAIGALPKEGVLQLLAFVVSLSFHHERRYWRRR